MHYFVIKSSRLKALSQALASHKGQLQSPNEFNFGDLIKALPLFFRLVLGALLFTQLFCNQKTCTFVIYIIIIDYMDVVI